MVFLSEESTKKKTNSPCIGLNFFFSLLPHHLLFFYFPSFFFFSLMQIPLAIFQMTNLCLCAQWNDDCDVRLLFRLFIFRFCTPNRDQSGSKHFGFVCTLKTSGTLLAINNEWQHEYGQLSFIYCSFVCLPLLLFFFFNSFLSIISFLGNFL